MMKFDWGKGIALSITIFVIATLSLVSYFISLDFFLVSNDHYEEGVQYQETIDSRSRSAGLEHPILVVFDEEIEALRIVFPTELVGRAQGDINLYRPNNPALDKMIPLSVNATGTQIIPVKGMEKGKWILKIFWVMDDQDYLEEKTIMI
tara:strand:- start:322 stop:768 length:447 start_codon:yes stop_codon:yes gene_type:complete